MISVLLVFGVVAWVAVLLGSPTFLAVAPVLVVAPPCSVDVLACDSDGDGFVNVVEEAVCGSATCATGVEDFDGDGVADVEQFAVSLSQGGPGGVVRFSQVGWVRVVLPGPVFVDVPWLPLVVAGVCVLVLVVVVRGRRRLGGAGEVSTLGCLVS